MKNTILGLAAALIAALFLAVPAQAGNAAMVMDLKGGILYQSGERTGQAVQLMDFLMVGESIDLKADGYLVLSYFESGVREEIRGPGGLTVDQTSSKAAGGTKVNKTMMDKVLAQSVGEAGHHFGTVALRKFTGSKDAVRIESLQNTAVRSGKLRFAWRAVDQVGAYKIEVKNDLAGNILEKKTADNFLDDPGDKFEPGETYSWTIQALSGEKTAARGKAEFYVLNDEDLAALTAVEKYIQKTLPAGSNEALVAYAQLYTQYELNDEARAVLGKLREEFPQNENITDQLAMLENNYSQ